MRSLLSRFRPDPALEGTPTAVPVREDARPFTSQGGPVGVLLCHGFTGTPRSMRPWADTFAAAGFTVSLPRLPGHGTSWQELNQTRWPDWFGEVERALADLTTSCEQVFCCGLSMGGGMALGLAERHPDKVAGLVLVNPCVHLADPQMRLLLPWLRFLVPSVAGVANDIAAGGDEGGYPRTPLQAAHSMNRMYAEFAAHLADVRCPVLLYRSLTDHVVDPSSAQLIRERVSGPVTERLLARSYHVATLDHDAETIFAGSLEFVREHSQEHSATEPAAAGPTNAGPTNAEPGGTDTA